jgi:5-methylcytosine-specific restriction endonuclease McrA
MKKYRSEYSKLLDDKRWNEKRKRIILRDKVCQMCGCKTHLQVHHLVYLKRSYPWEYPDDFLVVLCGRCHRKESLDNVLLNDKIKEMQLAGMWSAEIMQKFNIVF